MSKGVTDAQAILAKVHAAGWRVRIEGCTPKLVKAVPSAGPIPPGLLRELRENRVDLIRHLLIARVLARSSGRTVWGYCSDDRRPVPLKNRLLDTWNRICVEGDSEWTILPDPPTACRH